MKLTRILLDPAAYRARQLLANPAAMHAAVAASFPADRADEGRVLWRVDGPARGAHSAVDLRLLVSSPNGPDLAETVERIATPDCVATRDLTPLLDRLTAGETYSFRIAVNPTSYVRSETPIDRADGRHVRTHHRAPIGALTAQTAWLVARLGEAGAKINDTDVGGSAAVDVVPVGMSHDRFRRRKNRNDRPVELLRAHFQGNLTVLDAIALRRAIVTGIGPAKGYGCGLLTLAPAAR